MLAIFFLLAITCCQTMARVDFDDLRGNIQKNLKGRDAIGLVKFYSDQIEAKPSDRDKQSLASVLSTGYGVGGISDRPATSEERDIILNGAYLAFDRLGVDDIVACLSEGRKRDFTPLNTNTIPRNIFIHQSFIRAFGLAALYAKAQAYESATILRHVEQGFKGVEYVESTRILRSLIEYAENHNWKNYKTGFNYILAAIVGQEMKRQEDVGKIVFMPEGNDTSYPKTFWPKVVYVSTYNACSNHGVFFAFKFPNQHYVVFQTPMVTTLEHSYESRCLRAHGAVFPAAGPYSNNEIDCSASIILENNDNISLDDEGGVSIHQSDPEDPSSQSVLSPHNMKIPVSVLSKSTFLYRSYPFRKSDKEIYSLVSEVHPSGWRKPIRTFHFLKGNYEDRTNPVIRFMTARRYGSFKSDFLLKLFILASEDGKTHVQRMVEFISESL